MLGHKKYKSKTDKKSVKVISSSLLFIRVCLFHMKVSPGTEFLDNDRVRWLSSQHFPVRITIGNKVQHQRATGRCWLFALSNVARVVWRTNEDLSISFLAFHDAVQKCRKFLQLCCEWKNEDLRGRLMTWLLSDSNTFADGGQFDMAMRLLREHGWCYKSDYPAGETAVAHLSSLETRKLLRRRLRFEALKIFSYKDTPDVEGIVADIRATLLVPLFGEPPTVLTRPNGSISCLDFAKQQQSRFDLQKFRCLVNAPGYHPMHAKLHIHTLDSTYVNVEIEEMLQMCELQLTFGIPVWIGVDWGKCRNIPSGSLDCDMYRLFDEKLHMPTTMTKGDLLLSGESQMTHAVCLVGFDKSENGETRYRVENSHGLKGIDGFYHASNSYLRLYLFEAAILEELIPERIRKVFDSKEIVELPPWDPMGALA